ncbi:MAG TPA: hypothetical protein VFC41_03805 [Anaerovoracaceae bacterium]|nr:hypothetical protein [Anaerovoracaceae bacterium]
MDTKNGGWSPADNVGWPQLVVQGRIKGAAGQDRKGEAKDEHRLWGMSFLLWGQLYVEDCKLFTIKLEIVSTAMEVCDDSNTKISKKGRKLCDCAIENKRWNVNSKI